MSSCARPRARSPCCECRTCPECSMTLPCSSPCPARQRACRLRVLCPFTVDRFFHAWFQRSGNALPGWARSAAAGGCGADCPLRGQSGQRWARKNVRPSASRAARVPAAGGASAQAEAVALTLWQGRRRAGLCAQSNGLPPGGHRVTMSARPGRFPDSGGRAFAPLLPPPGARGMRFARLARPDSPPAPRGHAHGSPQTLTENTCQ